MRAIFIVVYYIRFWEITVERKAKSPPSKERIFRSRNMLACGLGGFLVLVNTSTSFLEASVGFFFPKANGHIHTKDNEANVGSNAIGRFNRELATAKVIHKPINGRPREAFLVFLDLGVKLRKVCVPPPTTNDLFNSRDNSIETSSKGLTSPIGANILIDGFNFH